LCKCWKNGELIPAPLKSNRNFKMHIRLIQEQDDQSVASLIRSVLKEHNADPETTALGDPSLDFMTETYNIPRACYFVVENNGVILGGGGIRGLDGSSENICELQKMYFLPELRGKGFGKKIIELCLLKAKEFQYEKVYLETLSHMLSAIALYNQFGFTPLSAPLGDTGHGGCNVYMLKSLN
jgi:putative acetyltransferase